MLLPSALTCDSSASQKYPRQPALYSSPPLSPPSSSYPTITNIYTTCRALQSMLTPPPAPTQLPSPPITHAEPPSTSPFKLRLRTRPSKVEDSATTHIAPRKRIAKRPPPRGANKRRRALSDVDEDSSYSSEEDTAAATAVPSTPKRMRLAPEVLPLGLERSNFHDLQQQAPSGQLENANSQEKEGEMTQSEEWSSEEDRILVELVLEKLRLTKVDWQDCAKSLGKDKYSVGKRWKSLMERGDIGLKKRRSRARLCGTWR